MTINHRRLDKILKEIFTEGDTIIVNGLSAQTTYIKDLYANKLKGIKSIYTSIKKVRYYQKTDYEEYLSFYYGRDDDYESMNNSFDIEFSGNKLTINEHYSRYEISDIKDIDILVERLKVEYEKAKSAKIKKEKIINLKTNAIVSAIKQIAEEEDIEYNFTSQKNKITLLIKLTNRDALHIDIPFSKFQEVIPLVQSAISEVKSLYSKGIVFKIKGDSPNTYWKNKKTND